MEVFVDNLKELIFETNKSLRQLAEESGVSAMRFSRYLKGFTPTIDVTLKIAKYFNCSLDYLFGLSEDKQTKKYKTFDYDINKFLGNYNKLLEENNITHFKFMKNSKFDESIIRHWKSGSIPRLDIVYYIARNLNGSIDNLIGRYWFNN